MQQKEKRPKFSVFTENKNKMLFGCKWKSIFMSTGSFVCLPNLFYIQAFYMHQLISYMIINEWFSIFIAEKNKIDLVGWLVGWLDFMAYQPW